MSNFGNDPLLHISPHDIITCVIRDRERYAHAMRQPHAKALVMYEYLDSVAQKKAKQVALMTAPGGKDE